jgi:hypothetical protein
MPTNPSFLPAGMDLVALLADDSRGPLDKEGRTTPPSLLADDDAVNQRRRRPWKRRRSADVVGKPVSDVAPATCDDQARQVHLVPSPLALPLSLSLPLYSTGMAV